MKNIHILPTDKPSILASLPCGTLEYSKTGQLFKETLDWKPQNIYITSDEEIKEGDWRLDIRNSNVYKSNKADSELYDNSFRKKIILTTDQDLIKDGVQAIDDEFLEWFVKNPSCEFVQTKNYHGIKTSIAEISAVSGNDNYNWKGIGDNRDYKIIIPKEEPDYTALLQPVGTKQECKGSFKDCFKPLDECVCDTIKQQQKKILIEMMQEDEELGLYNEKLEEDGTIIQFLCGSHSYDGVWFGDKHPYREGNFWWRSILKEWQQERSYSEEDLKEAYFSAIESTGEGWNGEYAEGNNPDIKDKFNEGFKEWFKQFSKLKNG